MKSDSKNKNQHSSSRRHFIKKAGLTVGAAGAVGVMNMAPEKKPAGKMEYRRLGRTGLKISTVVVGEMPWAHLHERAFDLGVNYWHKMGNFAFPEVFTKKDRDSFYCDMVIDTLNKEGAIAQFEWGLKYSGLKMIDFMKIHSLYREPEDVKKGEGIFQAFEYLKKQGKTRFLSIAQHGNTAKVLTACINSGHFDAIQPHFNRLSSPELFDMIALAKKHDIGIISKKVLLGGIPGWNRRTNLKEKVEKYLDSNTTMAQALIKWTLNVPGITAVVPLIKTVEQLEEDVAAGYISSESEMGKIQNDRALEKFVEVLDKDYCRSCATCLSVCPQKLAIPDIFRFSLYYTGYNQPDQAKKLYNKLSPGQKAARCDRCGVCEPACPHGLPIMEKLAEANSLLA